MSVVVTLVEANGPDSGGEITLANATGWEHDNHGYLDVLNANDIVATFHRDHWRDVQNG